MSDFTEPTQFTIGEITIDGKDVIGLFFSISIYENIYSPIITGNITLIDTDGAGFIETQGLEFIEEIKFSFTNANGTQLDFTGDLNGLRNEEVKNQKRMYTIDFTSKSVRKNEQTFIMEKFSDKSPEDIAKQMVEEELEATIDQFNGNGIPMTFTGGNRRPTDIIKYVLTHGVTQQSEESSGDSKEGTTKGTTGFLCWETLSGYRFSDVNSIMKGDIGESHTGFKTQLANYAVSMEKSMKGIIDYDFKQIGDFQSKLRSGGFKNRVITFNMDTGQYVEQVYDDTKNMTQKQQEYATAPSRVMVKAFTNERYEKGCTPAQPNTYDQSKKYLAQNAVMQNTFNDQIGNFTIPPDYSMRAGDSLEVKIPKVVSEKGGGYDKKHSGKYIIRQVGHHFMMDGRSYTKINTVRSTTQQDDASSQ